MQSYILSVFVDLSKDSLYHLVIGNKAFNNPVATGTGNINDDYYMADKLLERANEEFLECQEFSSRLDRYAEAAYHGSAEALYR
jgi:hypothetical protein